MRTNNRSKLRIERLAPGRYIGVAAAADALGVRRQTIYMFLGGWQKVLGADKRRRLVVVDRGTV